ncbi:MAG: hypothetical protein HOI66_11575 [Verrucomicrobia bacterium]|nr:hypothetical protein [Verrucomicrobiota bacterium]
MKLKIWSKKELENRDNWDFSYCNKWPEHAQQDVFQHEGSRDLGSKSLPFRKYPKMVERAINQPESAPENSTVESTDFLYIRKSNSDQSTISAIEAELDLIGMGCSEPLTYYHLITIDHSQSKTAIKKAFSEWLDTQQKNLKTPKKRGRPKCSTSIAHKLDSLAIRRFDSAGYNASQAEQLGFKPQNRTLLSNPTANFSDAVAAAEKQLTELHNFFSFVGLENFGAQSRINPNQFILDENS